MAIETKLDMPELSPFGIGRRREMTLDPLDERLYDLHSWEDDGSHIGQMVTISAPRPESLGSMRVTVPENDD